MKTATIYSKTFCPYCVKAKHLLDRLGYQYNEINIELDEVARAEMLKKSNGRTSVPQIFVEDYHIGGCDDLHSLHEKGELAAVFN